MDNTIRDGEELKTFSFIPESRYVVYARFKSEEEAMGSKDRIEFDGKII